MLNSFKKLIRVHFGFSKSETNGTLVLIFLMILFIVTPILWERFVPYEEYDGTRDRRILDSLVAVLESHNPGTSHLSNSQSIEPFHFNPNTIGYDSLMLLGLTEPVARRLINYRSSGGRFRQKKDVKRIYGLSTILYDQLEPYIHLPTSIPRSKGPRNLKTRRPREKPGTSDAGFATLDINMADTAHLRLISGIGPVRASRIVKYRDWLGGFISPSQYSELWGFDSLLLRRLSQATYIDSLFIPRRIDLDTSGIKTLSAHPYISFKLARVIVAYRDAHGPFQSKEDLLKIKVLSDSLFHKINPYLKKSF